MRSAVNVKTNPSSGRFVLTRLHSLSGVIPLGLFLLEHFFSNATAIISEENFNNTANLIQSIPFLIIFEFVLIALPLLFHAIYGLYIAFTSVSNTSHYSYRRNWFFLFQRISGVITLMFVVYHVWSFRIATAIHDQPVNYHLVSEHLQNPLIFLFYLLGVVSTAFHFSNGLATSLITWGITIGKKSQYVASQLSLGLFLLLSTAGIGILMAFI